MAVAISRAVAYAVFCTGSLRDRADLWSEIRAWEANETEDWIVLRRLLHSPTSFKQDLCWFPSPHHDSTKLLTLMSEALSPVGIRVFSFG